MKNCSNKSGEVDCQSYVMTGKTPAVHITRKATIRMLENIKKSVPNLILSEHQRRCHMLKLLPLVKTTGPENSHHQELGSRPLLPDQVKGPSQSVDIAVFQDTRRQSVSTSSH